MRAGDFPRSDQESALQPPTATTRKHALTFWKHRCDARASARAWLDLTGGHVMKGLCASFSAALLGASLLVATAHAQEARGIIIGRVTDSSDAVLPGALVTLAAGGGSTVTHPKGEYKQLRLRDVRSAGIAAPDRSTVVAPAGAAYVEHQSDLRSRHRLDPRRHELQRRQHYTEHTDGCRACSASP